MAIKLKAFTVLEAMVAMVIIMVVFGLSAYLFINISSSGFTPLKQRGYHAVKHFYTRTIMEHRYFEEGLQLNEITLHKTINDYPSSTPLKLMTISALKDSTVLYSMSESIYLIPEKP